MWKLVKDPNMMSARKRRSHGLKPLAEQEAMFMDWDVNWPQEPWPGYFKDATVPLMRDPIEEIAALARAMEARLAA